MGHLSFKEKLPEWYAEGLEPTEAQKKTGYTPGLKPPAQWFNWHLHRSYEVMKELQEKAIPIDRYTEDVTNTLFPDVDALEERLNTAQTTDITLQPGAQVIQAAKDARFRLGEVRGRTLINLLGNAGSCDSTQGWTGSSIPILSVDTSIYKDAPSSIRVQQQSSNSVGVSTPYFNVDSNGYYVAAAFLRFPATGFTQLTMYFEAQNSSGKLNSYTFTIDESHRLQWVPLAIPIGPSQFGNAAKLRIRFDATGGAPKDAFNVDSVRVYQITAEKYNELKGKAPEEISNQFPIYSAGMCGVDSPYAIGYGENLLPPFYEWTYIPDGSVTSGPYMLSQPDVGVGTWVHTEVSVKPNTNYWISIDPASTKDIKVMDADSKDNLIDAIKSGGFNSGNNTKVRVYAVGSAAGTIINPMLTVGTEPKPFKPRRDTVLAFQTELHANPFDGSDPDVLFENEGQYFKLAKWKKVVLDGSLNWLGTNLFPGFKVAVVDMLGGVAESQAVTKYNGAVLTKKTGVFSAPDMAALESDNKLRLSISNADSGWGELSKTETFSGDGAKKAFTLTPPNGLALMPSTFSVSVNGSPTTAYTYTSHVLTFTTAPAAGTDNVVITYSSAYVPTTDEIKAYFMGWRMFLWGAGPATPFNGEGTKGWGKIYCGVGINDNGCVSGSGTTSVPTVINDQGYTPYQLLYRLAKATVEPVVSEGCLTLNEGDNLVEVGTGIVLRERVAPSPFIDQSGAFTAYLFNTIGWPSLLKYKVDRLFRVYKNSQDDTALWNFRTDASYGKMRADILKEWFDTTASYSVTYIKLDKSPIQPITGSLAANEKAQISDLTAGVAEALQRVSVVEQKKADEDVPGWITPTLLNGWANYGGTANSVGYYKDSLGTVHLRGVVRLGTMGATLFTLIEGYKPKTQFNLGTVGDRGNDGKVPVHVSVNPSGQVVPTSTATIWISLDGLSFPTEQ